MVVLKRGLRLVAIGGGTGLASLLSGMRTYFHPTPEKRDRGYLLDKLTAIVTIADDGGKSGKLIDEFGILPPGDIRESLVSLSDDADLISKLFRFRLKGEGALGGHSFGNLFLTALIQLNEGQYLKAIQDASKVLRIEGTILPSTIDHVILCAELENGKILRGEPEISGNENSSIKRVFFTKRDDDTLKPYQCKALPNALKAIRKADAIIIGPGGLYTSIIPNLLVDEISAAIRESHTRKIYIANLMTQARKTDDFTLGDHLREIIKYGGFRLDYVLVNNRIISDDILNEYEKEKARQVLLDEDETTYSSKIIFGNSKPINLIEGTIIREEDLIREVEEKSVEGVNGRKEIKTKIVLRHDPDKLARSLMSILVAK
jgi:uncharacterized cofD-like protein